MVVEGGNEEPKVGGASSSSSPLPLSSASFGSADVSIHLFLTLSYTNVFSCPMFATVASSPSCLAFHMTNGCTMYRFHIESPTAVAFVLFKGLLDCLEEEGDGEREVEGDASGE